jgi:dipeptidyl aminopeptidase/acylaminoacyl peptidase
MGMILMFAVASTTTASALGVEDLFAGPTMSNVSLSPDGGKVIFVTDLEGRRGVALLDLSTGKSTPLVRASDEDIAFCAWKGNDYILYGGDNGGNESFALQSFHVADRRIQRLIESWGENNEMRQSGPAGTLVNLWRESARKIIVYGTRDARAWYGNFYAVDIGTGTREPVVSQSEKDARETLGTVFDNAGRLRVRCRVTEKAVVVEARLGNALVFSRLFDQPRDLILSGLPYAQILKDNRTLVFVDYSENDRGALVTWDLESGRKTKTLFVPPEGEITAVHLSPDRSLVIGAEYQDEKPRVWWSDDVWARTQTSLDKALPDTVNRITSISDDGKRIIAHSSSDRDPGGYWLIDRTSAKPRLVALGSINPKIDPKAMAPMEPIKFRARDGLEIAGYLTRPPARNKPLPLIIHPHGGPYGIRDEWGFDPEVQFMVALGYAVLQVNYRGSGGYGRKFLEAGRFEWGAKMQDDLTDAVNWAVSTGIADPDRVAISGASYGGYAALAGVAFTPNIYRCAINYVGVSNLSLLGEHDRGANPIYDELFFRKWIHSDKEILKHRSPLFAVGAIRVPTFHAYGVNDPRVELRHWKFLKAELDRLHKPYELLLEGEEGHGFRKTAGRLEYYRRVERFLRVNLPVEPLH